MIQFTDITLIEAQSSYKITCEIMGPTKWMLRTSAFVITPLIAARYMLHLWYNSKVYIMDTEHPPQPDVADDDIREIRVWCEKNGWKGPYINNLLIEDPRAEQFWYRLFRAGIVLNEKLEQIEQEEIDRLDKVNLKLED